ncbi:NAD(P)/FAD-dependent oxidoreductase [Actinomadura sp. WMMB 499]|uniref:NAD(P)/FAD-dependent oxidoreductase n=1 Tax=Actinomadura sp. WMMB 499 TaxID=1219491 RepID=UPI0012474CC8|nr:NAD(P)/FAD-dependent oxidoreductase [Actinomadura sp. WMMB 499]QFG24081.1 NAD(P)/FAD-dependent oxidoreductase [Actinomadura sp. WMMB 499]
MDTAADAVVIGGGAAGLSAGVVLARARFAVTVVDGGAPRNGPAAHMHGYLSRDGMAPRDFLGTGRDELARFGGTLVPGSVIGTGRAPGGTFELRLDDGRVLRARSVLVATGLTDELPDIPGLSERWASEVHHCPHCHGYEVRGRTIAVLGSAAMAAASRHIAALLRRYSDAVTYCVNGTDVGTAERRRLEAYGVRLVDGRVARIGTGAGPDPVVIDLDDGGSVACEAIFVAPRPVPHDSVLSMLGAARDPASGFVAVDPQGATDVPGLWAAGNVVSPRAQIVSAAGAGSAAAIGMTSWLLERELTAAARATGAGR